MLQFWGLSQILVKCVLHVEQTASGKRKQTTNEELQKTDKKQHTTNKEG